MIPSTLRASRETIWKRDWTNEFVIARRIAYTYDKVGNRERMTVTHDDLNTNGPCVTESLTTYAYDVNDRLTASTTTVTPLSPVAQARFNDYYAGRPKGWTRWVVLAFASVSLAAFFAPLLMPYGRRLGRRARRQRIRTACVAAFFVPLMAVDPQTVDALTTEALRAQAAIAAGIPLDCEEQPTTTVTYGYDANGNQTTRTTQHDGNTTVETFIFDVENRLVSYRKSVDNSPIHAASASYTYDADGVRTSKTTNSKTTLYTTDKNRPYAQVLEEREAKTGDLIVRYTYGDDLISQTRPQTGSADVTRYYHYDGQMSTRHLTDDSTIATSVATTDRYTYDAFGNDLGNDGTTRNAYRYTGEQFDEAVGQYYLRARYYDQGVGRFSARDTFDGFGSAPLTLHKYAYGAANPIANRDPTGLFNLSETLSAVSIGSIITVAIFTAVGAAFGAGASAHLHIVQNQSFDGLADAASKGALWGALYGAILGLAFVTGPLLFAIALWTVFGVNTTLALPILLDKRMRIETKVSVILFLALQGLLTARATASAGGQRGGFRPKVTAAAKEVLTGSDEGHYLGVINEAGAVEFYPAGNPGKFAYQGHADLINAGVVNPATNRGGFSVAVRGGRVQYMYARSTLNGSANEYALPGKVAESIFEQLPRNPNAELKPF